MEEKENYQENRITKKTLLLTLVIILAILPFLTAFSQQFTGLIQSTPIYIFIERYIVGFEVRIVGTILNLFKIPVGLAGSQISVKGQPMTVTWNCLGWQSMLFLLISLFAGLQGSYSLISKLQAVVFGLLGTFWINISRITFLAFLGGYAQPVFAVLFHDYFATFVTVCWLIFFWWFSFKFVLEKSSTDLTIQNSSGPA